MKSKKPLIWILVAVLVVVIGAVAYFGKQYYENRYVGTDYYTIVPANYDMTPVPIKSMSGEQVATGIKYDLTAYDANGNAKQVSFNVIDPNSNVSLGEKQPQPGTVLQVTASKSIVLHWKVIDKSQVPAAAWALIQKG